jgi:hypothetical protein
VKLPFASTLEQTEKMIENDLLSALKHAFDVLTKSPTNIMRADHKRAVPFTRRAPRNVKRPNSIL